MSHSRIALVHTVPGLVATFDALFAACSPEIDLEHVVEEGLLQRTIERGRLGPDVRRDLTEVVERVRGGADLVLVTCSTLGPAVDDLAATPGAPVMRVDEAMGREALRLGARIGVLATLTSTLEPTVQLLERLGAEGVGVPEIVAQLCDGAFEAVRAGDGDRHDQLVRAGLDRLLGQSVDVVVLAQASMARVVETLDPPPPIPVLSSPALAVDHAVSRLEQT